MISERTGVSRRAAMEYESKRERVRATKKRVKRCKICGGKVSEINICGSCGTKAE